MLRYNGETVQKLNERFNLHHAGSEHPFKHGHGKIPCAILLCYHVTKLLKHRKGMEGIKQEQWIHQKRKARYRMDQNTMYILPIWNER